MAGVLRPVRLVDGGVIGVVGFLEGDVAGEAAGSDAALGGVAAPAGGRPRPADGRRSAADDLWSRSHLLDFNVKAELLVRH